MDINYEANPRAGKQIPLGDGCYHIWLVASGLWHLVCHIFLGVNPHVRWFNLLFFAGFSFMFQMLVC